MVNLKGQTEIQKKRGLDTLRGIGITGIVLYHTFPSVFPGGFLGVPLFFVLSGYLMFVTSSASWEKGEFHIITYYKKRLLKIYPAMFAMVMVVCCYLTIFHKSRMIGMRGEICSILLGYDNWWQIQQNASYFTKITGASPFTHLWFLSMEMQLYLLWPLLFLLYQKGRQAIGGRKMCFLFLILALLSAARMWYLYVPGEDPSRVYYGTDTMAFSLFTGIFLGAFRQQYTGLPIPIKQKQETPISVELFVLAVLILFMTADGQSRFLYQGGMFLVSLFFACMIYVWEKQGEVMGSMLDSSLMALLGRHSYWIYLWHYPVIVLALL